MLVRFQPPLYIWKDWRGSGRCVRFAAKIVTLTLIGGGGGLIGGGDGLIDDGDGDGVSAGLSISLDTTIWLCGKEFRAIRASSCNYNHIMNFNQELWQFLFFLFFSHLIQPTV